MSKLKSLVARLGPFKSNFDSELAWIATIDVQPSKWRGSMRWIDSVRQRLGLDDGEKVGKNYDIQPCEVDGQPK